MADHLHLSALSDSELEQRLIDLGPRLYPAAPDLATEVRHRLESEPVGSPLTPNRHPLRGYPARQRQERGTGRLPPPRSEGRRVGDEGRSWAEGLRTRERWLIAVLLLIALVSGLVLFPRLGRPVTLAEAQAAVDFPVRVPTAAGFDAPGEIYLVDQEEGAMVSFVYPAAPGLPASDETGVGALLIQFRGEADRGLIEKGLPDDGAQGTHLEAVSVSGDPGFWISGAPHGFFLVCYDAGECRQERYRLAGNVLLWEQDGVTLRLESALSLQDALAIAESVPATQ
ncbi:MAG: uncharacterized protein K0S14_2676 [Thermomicrobiales bacterium]|nr:uncharacterized protein [Thermomicrobiales bacterium]